MGNFPLCIPRQDGVIFGDYSDELEQGELAVHYKYQPSQHNLNPTVNDEMNTSGQDKHDGTILGLELEQYSVSVVTKGLYSMLKLNIVSKDLQVLAAKFTTEYLWLHPTLYCIKGSATLVKLCINVGNNSTSGRQVMLFV